MPDVAGPLLTGNPWGGDGAAGEDLCGLLPAPRGHRGEALSDEDDPAAHQRTGASGVGSVGLGVLRTSGMKTVWPPMAEVRRLGQWAGGLGLHIPSLR